MRNERLKPISITNTVINRQTIDYSPEPKEQKATAIPIRQRILKAKSTDIPIQSHKMSRSCSILSETASSSSFIMKNNNEDKKCKNVLINQIRNNPNKKQGYYFKINQNNCDNNIINNSNSTLSATKRNPKIINRSNSSNNNISSLSLTHSHSFSFSNPNMLPKRRKRTRSIIQYIENGSKRNRRQERKASHYSSRSMDSRTERQVEKNNFELIQKYYQRAKREFGDVDNTRLIRRFRDVNNFRQKVIKDFSSGLTEEELKHAKHNYINILDYIDLENEYQRNVVKKKAKHFYKTRDYMYNENRCAQKKMLVDYSHLHHTLTFNNEEQIYDDDYTSRCVEHLNERNLEQIKKQGKEFADAFKYIGQEYQPIDPNISKYDPLRINYHNLSRKIKVRLLQKHYYDVDYDVLYEHSPKKLRDMGREIEMEVLRKVKKLQPKNTKEKFNKITNMKFKGVIGKYFGVPV